MPIVKLSASLPPGVSESRSGAQPDDDVLLAARDDHSGDHERGQRCERSDLESLAVHPC